MPNYRLHYFNGRGRAEVSRLLFVVAGVEFEDIRYEREEWPAKKPGFPFLQVPVLEIEGVDPPLTQSFAIQMYLAREFNLTGSNNLETTRIEEVQELTVDAWMAMVTAVMEKDETRKAERMKDFNETRCPTVLGNLEKVLCRNDDGNGFFVGDKLTIADLQVYSTMEARLIKALVDDRYPKLQAFFERISQIPSIAAYLERRPETQF